MSSFTESTDDILCYDDRGRLAMAGNTSFSYDRRGVLFERRNRQVATTYHYGKDTMLDTVLLPYGTVIRNSF